MKIVTWNVNSIITRLTRLELFLERHQPDVVCLQESKTVDEQFPSLALEQLGYRALTYGQKAYNGVALLLRKASLAAEPERVQRGFPGDPIPEDARVISADIHLEGEPAPTRVVCVYVVNGKSPSDPKYREKLAWLEALRDWLRDVCSPDEPLIVTGDFNVAPEDRDVYNPRFFKGRLLCSDEERAALQKLLDWGLVDLHRVYTDEEKIFSWWDYRYGGFRNNYGLRIDLFLGTKPVAARVEEVVVDKKERDPKSHESKPSDHAPVILTLA
ncbi:MAG: exodeoxyribonuclease III [Myxococcales bacterium]|nr:exodeoxyribonuclease III [Myxococcales bacterium]